MKTEKQSYKNRVIRMSDKTWELLKRKRWQSQKSWNLFLLDLIKNNEEKKYKNHRSGK